MRFWERKRGGERRYSLDRWISGSGGGGVFAEKQVEKVDAPWITGSLDQGGGGVFAEKQVEKVDGPWITGSVDQRKSE